MLTIEKNLLPLILTICLVGLYKTSYAWEGVCVANCEVPPVPEIYEPSVSSENSGETTDVQPVIDYEAIARAHYERGLAAREAGDPRRAIEHYNEALAVWNNYEFRRDKAIALSDLGIAAYNRGDYHEALEWFNQGNRVNRSNMTILYNLQQTELVIRKIEEREKLQNSLNSSFSNMPGSIVKEVPHAFTFKKSSKDIKRKEKAPIDKQTAIEKLQSKNIVSPLPRYGKGNKFSAPVDLRKNATGQGQGVLSGLNLNTNKGKTSTKSGLKIKDVPLPDKIQKENMAYPFSDDQYDGVESRVDLILTALEKGNGDLQRSIKYLDTRVQDEGSGLSGTDALSYLEGLYVGAVSANADVNGRTEIQFDGELLLAEREEKDEFSEGEKELLELSGMADYTWKQRRTKVMLDALEAGNGDYQKSLQHLVKIVNDRSMAALLSNHDDPADYTVKDAINAYNYLIGLKVYPELNAQSQSINP